MNFQTENQQQNNFLRSFSIGNSGLVGNVDTAVIEQKLGENKLRISGWVFSPASNIKSVVFEVPGVGKKETKLYFRDDINKASSDHPYSPQSGFVLEFILPDQIKLEHCELLCNANLANGQVSKCAFKGISIKYVDATSTNGEMVSLQDAHHALLEAEYSAFMKSNGKIEIMKSKGTPDVSVVILSYNRPYLLYKCLTNLLQNTHLSFEVIIVDNASDEATQRFLNRIEGATVFKNKVNLHFIRGSNQGARAAKGKYILFLNSDCFIYDTAIDCAVGLIEKNPEIGVVGAKLQRSNGLLYEAGCTIDRTAGQTWHSGYGEKFDSLLYSKNAFVDYVSGAFLLTPRKLFSKLEGFDVKLSPAYYEDVDYCLRLAKQGYRIAVCASSMAMHIGNASSTDRLNMKSLIEKNRRTIIKKHFRNQSKLNSDKFGVNVVGLYGSEKGVGESVRASVECLKTQNIPHALNPLIDIESSLSLGKDEFFYRTNPYKINLVHVHPPGMSGVLSVYGPSYFENKYNIAFWFWEQENLPHDWIPHFQRFDEIWSASDFCCEVFSKYTNKPVFKVPHIVEANFEGSESLAELDLLKLDKKFVFTFIFDFHSSHHRKNLIGLISAFSIAFANRKDVVLVVKSSRATRLQKAAFANMLKEMSVHNIILLDKILTKKQMNHLYDMTDVYVSLHRSEGFGITLADAMVRGILTIGTGYSGNLEFMNADNSLLVNYKKTALLNPDKFYPKGGIWAEPDLKHASELMVKAYKEFDQLSTKAKRGQKFIQENFNAKVISRIMKDRIDMIWKSLE